VLVSIIDNGYYSEVGAAAKTLRAGDDASPLSAEMLDFIDHLADLLAEEYAAALKEERDASSSLREVLEREPTRAEHRGSGSGLP
jgi:hypothetical protein